jgi:hypothetical protein
MSFLRHSWTHTVDTGFTRSQLEVDNQWADARGLSARLFCSFTTALPSAGADAKWESQLAKEIYSVPQLIQFATSYPLSESLVWYATREETTGYKWRNDIECREEFIHYIHSSNDYQLLCPYFDMGATRSRPEVGDEWQATLDFPKSIQVGIYCFFWFYLLNLYMRATRS